MEASEEMATQKMPRAMARAELVASAILPAVSELVRTRARVAQCGSGMVRAAVGTTAGEEGSDVRGGSGMVWTAVGTTAGGEGSQGLAPVRCLCRRK